MQIEDLHVKTKYLQLMRVTKQLQEFLKGGGEEQQAQELAALERRADHEKKAYDSKMEELHKRVAKIQSDTKAKERENERLSAEVSKAQASVSEREKIRRVQEQARQNEVGTQTRLQKLYAKERLEKTVRSQAAELDRLRFLAKTLVKQTYPDLPP